MEEGNGKACITKSVRPQFYQFFITFGFVVPTESSGGYKLYGLLCDRIYVNYVPLPVLIIIQDLLVFIRGS